jgi:uncharacterized protein (DUF433 family)
MTRLRSGRRSDLASCLGEHGCRSPVFHRSAPSWLHCRYGVQENHDQSPPDGGGPCLRALRIPVATVVALVAEGQATKGILALYPDLEADDVREALLFGAEAVRERALPLAAGE